MSALQNPDLSLENLIDDFAHLHIYLQDAQKRYDDMKKKLAVVANSVQSKERFRLHGLKYQLEFSESPQKAVIPEEVTSGVIYDLYGIGAFAPSVKFIKEIENLRTREVGFSASILKLKWDSRRLLNATKNS